MKKMNRIVIVAAVLCCSTSVVQPQQTINGTRVYKQATPPSAPSGTDVNLYNYSSRLLCKDNNSEDCFGFQPLGTSAILRSMASRLAETTSLRDFGAAGDGTTDDTAAIQAAFNYTAANCKELFVPNGTYLFSSMLTFSGCGVIHGPGTFKVKNTSNLDTYITIGGTNIAIRDVTFDFNRANNVGAAQRYGITSASVQYLLIDNVTAKNFYGYGSGTGVMVNLNGTDMVIVNSYFGPAGDVGHISDLLYTNGSKIRIAQNKFINATDTAIVCEAASECNVIGNNIIDSIGAIAVGAGTAASNGRGLTVVGNTITGGFPTITVSNGSLIYLYKNLGATNGKAVIANNVIRDTQEGYGIWCNGADNFAITGNVLYNIGLKVGATHYGMRLDSCTNGVVNDNVVQNTASYGVYFGSSTRDIAVMGNRFSNAGQQVAGAAIIDFGTGSSNIQVIGNSIFDTNTTPGNKKSDYCIDGSDTLGTKANMILLNNNYFDGTNATGCKLGNIRRAAAAPNFTTLTNDFTEPVNFSGGILSAPLKNQVDGGVLQAYKSSGTLVNLLALTNDVNNYTRYYAGDDTGGFQWVSQGGTNWMGLTAAGLAMNAVIYPKSYTFATLPAASNGAIVYCSDCGNVVNNAAVAGAACVGGGSGAIARVQNGRWDCN